MTEDHIGSCKDAAVYMFDENSENVYWAFQEKFLKILMTTLQREAAL